MANSPSVKTATVLLLCILVAAGILNTAASAADAATSMCPDHVADNDATLLLAQLRELDDEDARLAVELAAGGDGAGGDLCPGNCQKCLVKCAASCVADIVTPPAFVACFLKCAVLNTCFLKK
uniref:Uncharacterized protein n=1 Tax=Leersia perrieri TaxID=77586 RepID=A0A0D9XDL0_9ORYZ